MLNVSAGLTEIPETFNVFPQTPHETDPSMLDLDVDPEFFENYPGVDEDDAVADMLAALLGADGGFASSPPGRR